MRGSPSPSTGSWAPAVVEQASPSWDAPPTPDSDSRVQHMVVPWTPEALQATQEIMFLPVPPTPGTAAPKSRDKPALGLFHQTQLKNVQRRLLGYRHGFTECQRQSPGSR